MRMDTAGLCSSRLASWDMSLSHGTNFLGFLWDYYLFEMKIRSDRQKVKHSDLFILGGGRWVRGEGNIKLAGNYLAKQRYEVRVWKLGFFEVFMEISLIEFEWSFET